MKIDGDDLKSAEPAEESAESVAWSVAWLEESSKHYIWEAKTLVSLLLELK